MAPTKKEWNGNVWINDNWTDEEKAQALNSLAATRNEPESTLHNETSRDSQSQAQQALNQFRRNAGTNWNVFYEQNQNKFFKDRHYLHKAFPCEFAWLYPNDDVNEDEIDCPLEAETENCTREYSCAKQQSIEHWQKQQGIHIVEIGCGVGNAILPLLEQHSRLFNEHTLEPENGKNNLPDLHVHCLDFAPNAIDLLREDGRFQAASSQGRATAHVYDLSSTHPSIIPIGKGKKLENSADVAILLFCLSAIGPHPSPALTRAANHVMAMLKPGGILVIRDYGRLDEAQLKLGKGNKEILGNFYQKGDGTGVYYFELNDLKQLFGNVDGCTGKLNVLELDYIQRVYRNRGDDTTRRRVWVQGRFQKPLSPDQNGKDSALRDEQSLINEFLATANSRWDSFYRQTWQSQQLMETTLNEALSSKFPNNLLQIFPDEFGQWRTLIDPSKKTRENMNKMDQNSFGENEQGNESIVTVIDIGCGIGNGSLLNILAKQQLQARLSEQETQDKQHEHLERRPTLRTYFVDVSTEALQRLHNDPRYKFVESGQDEGINASQSLYLSSRVLDITSSNFPTENSNEPVLNGDMALLLFTLSTLGPYTDHPSCARLRHALTNVASMLKPGGIVLFRDYARHDDDQLQLNSCFGSQICDNFYFRDDATSVNNMGTAVYFFDVEEVRELFTSVGFEVLQLECIKRTYSKSGKNAKNLSVNGGAIKRTRIWVHGRFRKPEC